jgi:DNA-binding CsgD family transcriptional regulator
VPILSFYIDLHRGIIQLFSGDPQAARRSSRSAAAHLARASYDSPGDARLLALLEACIDFEQGNGTRLSRFLSLDLDELAQGEIWPSLVELVMTYGTQLLAEQYSTVAARSFLDRWRATGERSHQFQALIDIREMSVLQNANRWLEAAALAVRQPSPVTQDRVLAPTAPLGSLQDRDEIGLSLVWLRQAVRDMPARDGLDRQLLMLLDNPHLTARQRLGAELMRAQVLRRQERSADALAQLRNCLVTAAQRGTVAILRNERELLGDLLSVRRFREPLLQIEAVRRILRQVQGAAGGVSIRARDHGLTRQETRILHLLGEGAPNKTIAKSMGLSEATVKFHLANLYRKLGCSTRREAIAAGSALGLTS